jgi:hypothetical protein
MKTHLEERPEPDTSECHRCLSIPMVLCPREVERVVELPMASLAVLFVTSHMPQIWC